ncbi:MAG: ribonuclease P protein component [Luteitalea sp.]|nr:ribonuclease P protein component [Luteitalea sp.]
MRHTFRPTERIQRRADFQRIYTQGQKLHGRFMTLFVLATDAVGTRLGVAATRKLGDAVRRNRAKRLARELFRRHKPTPGIDLVLVPKRELLAQSFTRLETEFDTMIRRAGGRQRSTRP